MDEDDKPNLTLVASDGESVDEAQNHKRSALNAMLDAGDLVDVEAFDWFKEIRESADAADLFDDLMQRLIVMDDTRRSFWVWDEKRGGYAGPYPPALGVKSLDQKCPSLARRHMITAKGALRKTEEILARCSRILDSVVVDPKHAGLGRYDTEANAVVVKAGKGDAKKPVIDFSEEKTHEVVDAVLKDLGLMRRVFWKNGYVEVVEGRTGGEILKVQDMRFRKILAETFRWVEQGKDDYPGTDVGKTLVQEPPPEDFPVLAGLSGSSVIRPDGSIFRGPGWDDQTGTLVKKGAVLVEDPGDDPSEETVEKAKKRLLYLISDFPFRDEFDRGVALALILTTILRRWVDGVAPLFFLSGNKPGTAKGLLARLAHILAEGSELEAVIKWKGDVELEKETTTALMGGSRMVLWDEVPVGSDLQSKYLDNTLTSPTYFARKLGSNGSFCEPNRFVWCAAGNNVSIATRDLFRRSVVVRLETDQEDPESRTDFQIQGGTDGLLRFAKKRRADVVFGAVALVRAFVRDKSPQPAVGGTMGSFEAWCEKIRAMVVHHFGPERDPLGNRKELRGSIRGGHNYGVEQLLVLAWSSKKSAEWTVKDLVTMKGAAESLVEELTPKADTPKAVQTHVGMLLRQFFNVPVRVQDKEVSSTVKLVRSSSRSDRGWTYHLEPLARASKES